MTATTTTDNSKRPTRGVWRRVWLPVLGSMNVAILLLMMLAVASVVGSVLQQNQPYEDYVLKFGSFWFDVYRTLGLYDVYHAGWFVAILVFLVASVSVCIYRNTPMMLRDTRRWRDDVGARSLAGMRTSRKLDLKAHDAAPDAETFATVAAKVLKNAGYKSRVSNDGAHTLVAAKRGSGNRYGYIATHLAIVVICVGGLFDSNFGLMFDEFRGKVQIERRNIPASEVGEISRLDTKSRSFRGQVNIPEGARADFIFLNVRDGYVVQELPFAVEVKEFRVEHYDNGMPKSFETDLVVHDDTLDKPLEKTISVNHPLTHRGVTIYQASFQDGGSDLTFKVWPLNGAVPAFEMKGTIGREVDLPGLGYTMELDDFRKFNVVDVAKDKKQPDFSNMGSSTTFKLRNADGKALEYDNYMAPVIEDGKPYFLTGVRSSPAEEFNYLRLPLDENGSLERFVQIYSRLQDTQELERIAQGMTGAQAGDDLGSKTVALLQLFAQRGFAGIEALVQDNVPEAEREKVFDAYFNIVRLAVARLYSDQLASEGVDLSQEWDEDDTRYLADFMTAITGLPVYGPPVFFQLTNFEHREASGLEMTKSPGKHLVFLGSALLCLGVFLLFYINPRRVWAMLRDDGVVLVAGTNHRKAPGFEEELDQIRVTLAKAVTGHNSTAEGDTRSAPQWTSAR